MSTPQLGGRLHRLRHRAGALQAARARRRDLRRPLAEPRSRAARRRPSAIGERQMFPVQTTRMEVMGPGHPGGGESNSGALAAQELADALSVRRPPARRMRASAVREVDDGRGRPSSGSLLAQVHGDQVSERDMQLLARTAGGAPERFALVTASGPARREHRERQRMGGTRTPDRRRPSRRGPTSGCARERGSTSVSGPGQSATARRSARSSRPRPRPGGVERWRPAPAASRSRGRRLASNRRAVAAGSSGRRRSRTPCPSGTR